MTRFLMACTLLAASTAVAPFASDLAAAELCVCRYCQGLRMAEEEPGQVSGDRKYAPDRVVDVLNTKIDVTPNYEDHTLVGETTLTFKPISRPVEEVTLDAVDLRIESVEGSQKIKQWDNDGRQLTVLFAEPLKVGREAEVVIKYTAEPEKGLYFRTKKDGYPDGDMHLWTQGEPHEARHWFPNFDYPNERATSEVICRVPEELTVVSNGRVVSSEVDPETGLKAVHWKQDKPHPSYLICLVAGRLVKLEDKAGDIALGFYTQPSLEEHAKNSFADTAQIMEFYQEEIGVPYPWDKYDQVTCKDFVAGGMENTTLTVLTDNTIFSTETENIKSSRNLDAHELAHQWFGDYVTCEDWSNLWLNEGFATYYTHLYDGHKLGRDHLLYGLYRDANGRVLTQDKDTRPIVYRDYKAAWDQFDFRAYPKGSWVLHMLRSQLGEDVYRQAIKNYLEEHALSSVTTPDLVAELEDASGRSLDRFFDQYVYHGGFPKLSISYKWLPKEGLARVTIKQTQDVNDDVLLFQIPTKLRFTVDGKVIDREIDINDKQQDFYVPLPGKPSLVRFDPEYTVLAKVEFDKPQEMLEEQLSNKDDVIGRLIAVEELGGKKDKKSLEALRQALNADPFYGVRTAAANELADRQSDEAFDALIASTSQEDARVRQAVVKAIGDYYRPAAQERLQEVVSKEKNPEIVAAALRGLSAYSTPEVQAALRKAMASKAFRNAPAVAAIDAASRTADPALAPAVMGTLKTRRHELDGRGMSEALQSLGDLAKGSDHAGAARELILGYLNDPSSRVRSAAAAALGNLGDRRALAPLRTLADRGDSRVGGAAKQAIEKIEKEAPTAPAEVKELRKLVRELQKQQDKLEEQVQELTDKEEAKAGAEAKAKADA